MTLEELLPTKYENQEAEGVRQWANKKHKEALRLQKEALRQRLIACIAETDSGPHFDDAKCNALINELQGD